MQNAFVEFFIGHLRDEFLNETLFHSLTHTRAILEAWRTGYNDERPGSAPPRLHSADCRLYGPTGHYQARIQSLLDNFSADADRGAMLDRRAGSW